MLRPDRLSSFGNCLLNTSVSAESQLRAKTEADWRFIDCLLRAKSGRLTGRSGYIFLLIGFSDPVTFTIQKLPSGMFFVFTLPISASVVHEMEFLRVYT